MGVLERTRFTALSWMQVTLLVATDGEQRSA